MKKIQKITFKSAISTDIDGRYQTSNLSFTTMGHQLEVFRCFSHDQNIKL